MQELLSLEDPEHKMADEAARGKAWFRTLQVLVNYLFIIIIINYMRWQMKQHEAKVCSVLCRY